MCVDNGVSKILKEGVVIDARFPLNMELAYEVLIREGYNKKKDFLYITTQYEHQYTELKYNKTATYIDEKTGEQCQGRYFSLQVPDRYVPSKKDVRADGRTLINFVNRCQKRRAIKLSFKNIYENKKRV